MKPKEDYERVEFNNRREYIKRKFSNKGYKLCPVEVPSFGQGGMNTHRCNTPIRPKLFITPTDQITTRRRVLNRPLKLEIMCEVCYREFASDNEHRICDHRIARSLIFL